MVAMFEQFGETCPARLPGTVTTSAMSGGSYHVLIIFLTRERIGVATSRPDPLRILGLLRTGFRVRVVRLDAGPNGYKFRCAP